MSPDAKHEQFQSPDTTTINHDVHRVAFNLNLHSPVEQKISQIITNKKSIRVGSLRYIIGEDLLKELLLRGAESLEAEFPNVLGINDVLSEFKSLPTLHKIEDKKETKPPCPKPPLAEAKTETSVSQNLVIPDLNLDGFDFGSSVIEGN